MTSKCLRWLVAGVLLLCLLTAGVSGWKYRSDAGNSGNYIDTSGKFPTNNVLWTFPTLGKVDLNPAVANNVVYFAGDDGYVYAADAVTGAEIWNYPTEIEVYSSPAVINGVVYIGDYWGNLSALDAGTGAVKWQYETDDLVDTGPVVANGVVYFGNWAGTVFALNADTGATIWTYEILTGTGSPAIANNVLYITNHSSIFAMNAVSGAPIWSWTTGYEVSDPVVVNGILYLSTYDRLFALNAATGAQIWNAPIGLGTYTPAVADGVVFAANGPTFVYAFDANTGASLWTHEITSGANYGPVVSNGRVYIADVFNVYALDAGTGAEIWNMAMSSYGNAPPAVANGILYVGTGDALVALGEPPAAPTVTGINPDNAANTGEVYVNVYGTGFVDLPTVSLQPACDVGSISCTGVTFVSSEEVTCVFDLTGACPGPATVYVMNPDMTSGQLDYGFTITGPLEDCAVVLSDNTQEVGAWIGELDFDGVPGGNDILWYVGKTADEMRPENGAKITNVGDFYPFDKLTVDYLTSEYYTLNPIDGDMLTVGDIFAVETNLGNFTKVLVEDRTDSVLTLHQVTYSVGACKETGSQNAEPPTGIPPGATWYVSDKPVPAGDVFQWGPEDRKCTISCEAWAYLLDPTPDKNWEHDVTWYFSCVDEPTVVTTCTATTPPNEVRLLYLKGVLPKRSGFTELKLRSLEGLMGDGAGRMFFGDNTGGACGPLAMNCENCYALLISGGYDVDNNNERYYQDIAAMYQTLINQPYCYPQENIYVLMSDGDASTPDKITDTGAYVSSDPWLGQTYVLRPQHYSDAYRTTLDTTLETLRNTLGDGDSLFVFVTNHGGQDPEGINGVRLWLWNHDWIWAQDFVNALPQNVETVVMTMEQCFSGGFVTPFTGYTGAQQKVIATAASATEPSNLNYFSYYWIKGVKGPANANPDNHVQMSEAFAYARDNDPSAQAGAPANLHETPQYWDSSGAGQVLALSSCSICPEPTALPGYSKPTDPDLDGTYENLDGQNGFTTEDVILYFNQMDTISTTEPICAFDTNANGRIDFADVVNLYQEEVAQP